MNRLTKLFSSLMVLAFCVPVLSSCDDGETYADMKEKEKNAINNFIKDNNIKVITESEFYNNDSITDLDENEFVCFSSTGIYMQIVRRGEGKSMIEMAKEFPDSTVTKVVLCRFMEYDIEAGDTVDSDLDKSSILEKLQVKYSQKSRTYTASFTEGLMKSNYGSSAVPSGWMKPMDFIRISRQPDPNNAKVRLIVPHTSGTSNASGYVLPMYYEITYQLGV